MTSQYGELISPAGKRKHWARRLELAAISLVLSCGWAGVGFTIGAQRDADKDVDSGKRQAAALQRLRKEHSEELSRVQASCIKGLGDTAKGVAEAIGSQQHNKGKP